MTYWIRRISILALVSLWCATALAAYCVKCGDKLSSKAKFCVKCGHKVGAPLKAKKKAVKPKPKSVPEYDSIEEADNYFDLAEKERKSIGAFLLPNIKRRRYAKARNLYLRILEKWPNSNKCELAAYRSAQIYASAAFKKWNDSIRYYKMVLAINPETTLDSRLRIARVTEKKIKDYAAAETLYEDCIENARVQTEKNAAAKALKALREKMAKAREKLEE